MKLLRRRRQALFTLVILTFLTTGFGFCDAGNTRYKIGVPDETWVNRTLRNLSLREKIAQLIQIRVRGKFINRQSSEFRAIKEQVSRTGVGGVVLFAGNVYESAVLLNELQNASRLPLLVSADFERGASFRIDGTTSFPWAMAIGATGSEDLAYREGAVTAQESRALGVHWIFAPVLDVNNNPENPVINIRSYGEDPQLVARLGAAFIRGARDGGVLTTAKHFPGHGDTKTDSHIGLAVVPSDLARLESVELVPFKKAISAGVDAVMTAHVAVPEVTGSPETPATLSAKILTGLLQDSLKFHGIVVTDALEMGGITNRYWSGLAAVRAIQAGADVLLLPKNVEAVINEVERAVKRGDISEARIDRSVKKILGTKSSLELPKNRTVSIDRINSAVADPQNEKLAQEIADGSITAVKDEQHLLPINPLDDRRIFSLALASDIDSSPLSLFQSEMRRRFSSVQTMWGDARISDELSKEIKKAASRSDLIVCSTLVRLSSGRGDIALPGKLRKLIRTLLALKKPFVWVAFGNPYVFMSAPRAGTYVCTFSYCDTSQIAAARALSGEIPISGKLPVSIPKYFDVGSGLKIPEVDMTLQPSSETGPPQSSFDETRQLLDSFIESGALPGAEIIAGRNNSVVWEHYVGRIAEAAGSPEVSSGTVYDLSSLSRIVGTTSAAMLAASSGDLVLSAPVRDYLPESSSIGRDVSVQDLLTRYTASADDSDMLLLNEIVTRASGSSISRYLASMLFDPLGMKSTFSTTPQKPGYSVARVETGVKEQLCSNAHDLAVFAQMLLNGGIYDYRRFFSPWIHRRFTGYGSARTMGWSQPSRANWTGGLFSASAFGHNAPSGSSLWIDPSKRMFVVLLTNATDSQKAAEAQETLLKSIVQAVQENRP